MSGKSLIILLTGMLFLILMAGLPQEQCFAHCDTLDGPVVKAAESALETGDLNLVLIWVQKDGEMEVREAFEKARAVRKLGKEAQELADRYFFETVVRIHRAGEGAPYMGLKPAGLDMGPAIPAADKAIESDSPDKVLDLLTDAVRDGLKSRFAQVKSKKNFPGNDVEAGREYVKSYVIFIHYVEGLYESATKAGSEHGHESIDEHEK